MKEIIVAPSILSANFSSIEKDLSDLYFAGAKFLHFDVMDGHFVNNLSFGAPVLNSINLFHLMINDVHLMVTDPIKYIDEFYKAKADYLTAHIEAFNSEKEVYEFINKVHEKKMKVGLSIKPKTGVEAIKKYLKDIDLVLVMSVEPGFGGQAFLYNSIKKIEELDEYRTKNKAKYLIEVDGGINLETAKKTIDAGVDILVAGSYIFKSNDFKKAIDELKGVKQ